MQCLTAMLPFSYANLVNHLFDSLKYSVLHETYQKVCAGSERDMIIQFRFSMFDKTNTMYLFPNLRHWLWIKSGLPKVAPMVHVSDYTRKYASHWETYQRHTVFNCLDNANSNVKVYPLHFVQLYNFNLPIRFGLIEIGFRKMRNRKTWKSLGMRWSK